MPAFEEIKPIGSWAGFYEYNTYDQNAIIGKHPEHPNLVLANGFSGHGLQQSPATGRAVSELVLSGHFETMDLACFNLERIKENRPMIEKNVY